MTHYADKDRGVKTPVERRYGTTECVLCGDPIEENHADHPPKPQCYACAMVHDDAVEEFGPE